MNRLFLSMVVAALALAGAARGAGASASTPRKMPELLRDTTALNEAANGPAVMSYADVLEPVQKTVVTIDASKTTPLPPAIRRMLGRQAPPDPKEEGLGSGVIISTDGYILTNNHVVEGADDLKVTLPDSRDFKATLVGADPKTDIAIIKIDATDLPQITLADSDKLRVGDVVFAIGNPLGVGQTVTMGIVSAKGRSIGILEDVQGYEDFIQTDAAINMGNSGGALVDARGRLVGINGAILSPTSGSIGIGFAVPVNLAANIMQGLIESGTVKRGYLGIDVDPITADLAASLDLKSDVRGVVVTGVFPDTPASKAGLKVYDVVVSLDGHAITSKSDLGLFVSQKSPGSTSDLKYLRSGKEESVQVTFSERSDLAPGEILTGITVAPLDEEVRKAQKIRPQIQDGLVITAVDPNSKYASDFDVGSVILQINRVDVKTVNDALAALRDSRSVSARDTRKVALMLIASRGGMPRTVTVDVSDR